MVDCQIHTMGVVDPVILDAYRTIPRERFVFPGQEGIAYCDEDLPLGAGRFLMEPSVHARLVQAAAPRPDDVVLDIGAATGYSAAIFSSLVTTVIATEGNPELLRYAEAAWAELSLCNIAGFEGAADKGAPEHGPYSLVFLGGAVAFIPERVLDQVAVGGRLITVVTQAGCGVGKATLVERLDEDQFSSRVLFDAATPYLPGLEPRKQFVFQSA
jgi:protein-L-isoaspartate(D-aspartate) O-methyltransferase